MGQHFLYAGDTQVEEKPGRRGESQPVNTIYVPYSCFVDPVGTAPGEETLKGILDSRFRTKDF